MSPLKKYWPSMTALLLASCALPGAAMAQQAAPRGEAATVADVVVTGVRASQKAAEAVEFGNQVQVIRAEEIRASGATNMAELMQFLAKGVNIGYSPDEGEYTIRLDGGGDRDTLVVLDGVPLYDRGPALEDIWGSTTIDPHMIERVEVFRGGNSLFFGSNGGVGVISLVTKKPDGTTKGEIGVTYGSFETRELWANYSFPLDKDGRHSLMVYGSELATDGPRIFDPTKFVDNVALAGGIQTYALNRNNIGAKYLWKIDTDTELLLNAQYTELWFQDAFPNTEVFSPNTTRYPIVDAAFSHRWNESVLTEVNAYYSNPTLYNTELYPEVCLIDAGCVDPNNPQVVIPKGAWTGAVEPFLRKGFGEGNQNKGGFKEYGATVRNTLNFGSHFEMVAGAQWVRFQNDSDPVYFVGNEATTVTGLFVDARPRLPFSPDTAISLAVRTDFSNAFDSKTIWKFGFRQPLPGGFYVRANGGTSYSLPRNTELYRNFDVPEGTPITVIGNPNLRPEETESYSAGVGGTRVFGDAVVSAEIGGFWTDITDRIQTTSGLEVNTYFNNDAVTEIRGLNAELDISIGDQWRFNAGYTKQDSSLAEGPMAGVQTNETPTWFATATASWQSQDGRLHLQVNPRFQGDEFATGGPSVNGVPMFRHNFGNYTVVNATIAYLLGEDKNKRIQLRIANIFDEYYAERFGYGNMFYSSAYNRGEIVRNSKEYFFAYPFEGKPRSFYLSFSSNF